MKLSKRPQILNANAYKVLVETWDKDKIEFVEQFKVMVLNRANRVLGICTVSTGSVSGTVVDPKLIFAIALIANGSEIILAHNHPSGNLTPSTADHNIIQKLKTAGKYLELNVSDHLIITTDGFYSFAREGVL